MSDEKLNELLDEFFEGDAELEYSGTLEGMKSFARKYASVETSKLQDRIIDLELEVERQHMAFYKQKLDAGKRYNRVVHNYVQHPLLVKE